MKKLLLICLIASATLTVNAQYKWGIGAALGSPSGLSVKVFTGENTAFDFTGGFWRDYTNLTGMYEIHNSLANQLKWYYGPGAHLGSWNTNHWNDNNSHDNLFIGIDGVLGLEWKPDIPFAFSVDIRPGLNIVGGTDFFWQSQLGIRYTFGR
jgi:hypothetical protein